MNLAFCHRAINIILDFKDPFAIHWFAIRWKRINIQILLNYKDWNLKSMTFFQCCESSPFKASTKEWSWSISTKKTHERFTYSSTIVGFSCTYWGIISSSIFSFWFKYICSYLASYVTTCTSHIFNKWTFGSSFQLHHFVLVCMEWWSTSQCHSPCKMY